MISKRVNAQDFCTGIKLYSYLGYEGVIQESHHIYLGICFLTSWDSGFCCLKRNMI